MLADETSACVLLIGKPQPQLINQYWIAVLQGDLLFASWEVRTGFRTL